MTLNDFERIVFLLQTLNLKHYLFYVQLRFDDVMKRWEERFDFLYEKDILGSEWDIEKHEMPQEDQWFQEFCNGIKNEHTREKLMNLYEYGN